MISKSDHRREHCDETLKHKIFFPGVDILNYG